MALMGESASLPDVSGIFTGHVNGIITGCGGQRIRSFYRYMDTKRVLKRIERRLDAVGLSADAASKKAGKPDAIRNLRRTVEDGSGRGIAVKTVQALAPVLRTTPSWIIEELGEEDIDSKAPTIPVKGKVGPGGVVMPADDVEPIVAPHGSTSLTSAIQILPGFAGPLWDGFFIIYDAPSDDAVAKELVDEVCVVELADGQRLVRRLRKGRGKRFTLEANYEAPILDAAVVWAAKVKTTVPR